MVDMQLRNFPSLEFWTKLQRELTKFQRVLEKCPYFVSCGTSVISELLVLFKCIFLEVAILNVQS